MRLTFILRTPASPWIPTGMWQCHPMLMPGVGARVTWTHAPWQRGTGRGQLLTQPQLHLITSQLEGGLGARHTAWRQAEPQSACRRGKAKGMRARFQGRRWARGWLDGEAGGRLCPRHAAGAWGAEVHPVLVPLIRHCGGTEMGLGTGIGPRAHTHGFGDC